MTHHSWWMVVAACAIVYAGALRCGFAFDDHLMIEGNRVVQAGTLRDIFGGEYWGTIAPGAQSHGYRPVTILTLRANHALSGLAPWSYHAMNVLLHALVSLAVLSVPRRLGLPERAALAAALLRVLDDPGDLGEAGRRRARAEFSVERMALRTLDVYTKAR